MRRALLPGLVSLLIVPFLTACGPSTPGQVTQARSHLDVASPDLVAFKKHSDIPNCPKVTAKGVDGGMPDVRLPCLGGGRAVDVAGLRGPMIVNFWQAFCVPCRKEMPALAEFARSQSRVRVLGIDYLDVQPAAALKLARDSKVAYPLVADPGGSLDHAGSLPHIQGLPFTAFIAADGSIAHLEYGAFTSAAAVASAAEKYLGTSG